MEAGVGFDLMNKSIKLHRIKNHEIFTVLQTLLHLVI
nr:MAG TPA: hypothetical protein [Caudoviricetes sp.]